LCPEHASDGGHLKRERAADAFAAAFLLPEAGVLEMVPPSERRTGMVSIDSVLRIEQRYRCSRSALLRRLVELALLPEQEVRSFQDNVARVAREHGFDTALYLPGNDGLIIGRYGSLARRLFETDRISRTHYLALLRDIGIELEYGDEATDGRS
jgi:Zn-dependent peptidase ImmA (M78 family)